MTGSPKRNPIFLWVLRLLLAVPAGVVLYLYAGDALSYGEVIHETGDFAARLLIVTLAATPFRMLLPWAGFTRWLFERRRDFGVATFCYGLLHTLVYLQRKGELGLIIEEGMDIGLWTGWLALAIFVPLAITSNDASVRLLRRWWKRLHRLVYAGAVLTFAHWLLTAFDMVPGLIHAGILAGIMCMRLVLNLRGYARR
jgi:methionine sulfoxide reductase heme-binding subunit